MRLDNSHEHVVVVGQPPGGAIREIAAAVCGLWKIHKILEIGQIFLSEFHHLIFNAQGMYITISKKSLIKQNSIGNNML